MSAYMTQRMEELRGAVVESKFRQRAFVFVLTTGLLVLLPYIHLGVIYMRILGPNKPQVDRNTCGCSCFDTVFRTPYENSPEKIRYKHVYFNATANTVKIWVITIVFVLMLYESLRHMAGIFCSPVPVRWSMLFLFVVNIYPLYYDWWSGFFSYYNEELYQYVNQNYLFTLTEFITTSVVLSLLDASKDFPSWKLTVVVSISITHIVVSGLDQFIQQVLLRSGRAFQVSRNLGLMMPDVLHVLVMLWQYLREAGACKLGTSKPVWQVLKSCPKEDYVLMVLFILGGTFLGRVL